MSTQKTLVVLTMILGIVCPTWAGDADNDGVSDAVDVCSNTPAGTLVDAEGRPVGDLDKDCDNDLDDFTLSQQGFTGPLPPPRMALIPAGVFQMGDTFYEGLPDGRELPVHPIYVDAFYIGIYEVSNQQYADLLNWAYSQGDLISVTSNGVYQAGSGTSYPYCSVNSNDTDSCILWDGNTFSVEPDRENHPMVTVSWWGAVAYANWKSEIEGLPPCYDLSTWSCNFSIGYRLPTEAEWEKAARGSINGLRFPWGNLIDHSYANYRANGSAFPYDDSPYTSYTYHPDFDDNGFPNTSPVGHFAPNGYGLYDMVGNVWEWCNDWISETYYVNSPYYNPLGPPTGDRRILRGGSWYNYADYSRSSVRYCSYPVNRYRDNGFRLVRGCE